MKSPYKITILSASPFLRSSVSPQVRGPGRSAATAAPQGPQGPGDTVGGCEILHQAWFSTL